MNANIIRTKQRFTPNIVAVSLAFCVTATSIAGQKKEVASAFKLLPLPSISATYREFHEDSGTELSKARVHLSPFGLRIEQKAEGVRIAVYHNFMTGQMWFLNHERGVMHEVPLDLSAADRPEDAAETAFRLGFIDTEPCSSLAGVKRMNVLWRGRLVSLWDCYLEPNEAVAMQHYDDSIGLVVRSEYVDGVVMQLEEVQDRRFEQSYFVPLNKYRIVSMDDLMNGTPEIEKYTK